MARIRVLALSVVYLMLPILLQAQPGTVLDVTKISKTSGGFPDPIQTGFSGAEGIGDFDGDGIPDLTFWDAGYDDGGSNRGCFWIALMQRDGSFKQVQRISDTEGGFTGLLNDNDNFARASSLGDLNGDGTMDLWVSVRGSDTTGTNQGAAFVLFMNPDLTVASHVLIAEGYGGFTGDLDDNDRFGRGQAIGDLDGDGITEVAAFTEWDDDGGLDKGAVWILFMNADGTVRSHQKISDTEGGFTGGVSLHGKFAWTVAPLGDLDGDGILDIAVGEAWGDAAGLDKGIVWIMFLRSDGTVRDHVRITSGQNGFPSVLNVADHFGGSLTNLGDIDGDGVIDLLVGTEGIDDDYSGWNDRTGGVYILFLNTNGTVKASQRISKTSGGLGVPLQTRDIFGSYVSGIGDLDGDGKMDVAVEAAWDDDGGTDIGAVYLLNLEGVSTPPPATPIVSINCGGPDYVDAEGVTWMADQYYDVGGGWTNVHLDSVAGAEEDELYFSEHVWGQQWGGYGFTYNIPVPNGQYEVLLKFAEIWFQATGGSTGGGVGSRIFDVQLEGETVLDDYDIFADVGTMRAIDHSFHTTVSDGVMEIAFIAEHHNAKVSAIQIRALPGGVCLPPEGLSTDVLSNEAVELHWDPVPGAEGYRIQALRDGAPHPRFAASATHSKRMEMDFPPDTRVQWRVRAKCADDTSAWSEVQSFWIPDDTCAAVPEGLRAWWRLEDNGEDAYARNHGTLHGSVGFAEGMVGQALDCDGNDDRIEIPDAAPLEPTDALSLEAWIWLAETDQHADLLSKDGEGLGDRQYLLNVQSSNLLKAHVGVPSGFQHFTGNSVLEAERWYHVAMTYDGDSLVLYLDGRRDGSKAVHGAIIGGSQPFRIGGGAPAGEATYYFEGLIDEAALYDRALSAEEVAAQYRAGWHGKCAVPAYCSMPSAPVLMGLSGPVAQVAWDACGEADRYALFYRSVGDSDFEGLITFDTTAAFVVEPGLSYEVLVKARCSGANGPASDTLWFTVPLVREAAMATTLHPNPCSTRLTLHLDGRIGERVEWSMVGMDGRVLQSEERILDAEHIDVQLFVGYLADGLYTLVVRSERGLQMLPFIKQR